AGLSLLAGATFPRAAARALAEVAVGASEAPDPEGDVAALVVLHLVETLAGERLRLHLLLREYAAGKLRERERAEPGAEGRLGDAMVAYWLTYARAHPGYEGMDALQDEAAGLLGAVTWAHAHARHRDLLALAYALNDFWFVRGRIDEARLARPWALDAAQALGDVRDQRFMQHKLAVFLFQTGHPAEARAGYDRAL